MADKSKSKPTPTNNVTISKYCSNCKSETNFKRVDDLYEQCGYCNKKRYFEKSPNVNSNILYTVQKYCKICYSNSNFKCSESDSSYGYEVCCFCNNRRKFEKNESDKTNIPTVLKKCDNCHHKTNFKYVGNDVEACCYCGERKRFAKKKWYKLFC